ncbi:hypothetical protein EVA_21130 [gut metagenome]|uniref:Uncharacterized protein n=1 Tax=gut metagenome TaxID=749906 RepID=J9FMB7_9ZZZZ
MFGSDETSRQAGIQYRQKYDSAAGELRPYQSRRASGKSDR